MSLRADHGRGERRLGLPRGIARVRRFMVPVLLLAAATLVCVVAAPAGRVAAATAGLLPVLVIHYLVRRGDVAVPVVASFAAGLFADAASGGPLGYFAVLYLAAAGLATWLDDLPVTAAVTAFGLVANLAAMAALQAGLAAIYWLEPVAVGPLAAAVVAATALYFPLAVIANVLLPHSGRHRGQP